jgi:hypothetical protein
MEQMNKQALAKLDEWNVTLANVDRSTEAGRVLAAALKELIHATEERLAMFAKGEKNEGLIIANYQRIEKAMKEVDRLNGREGGTVAH